MLLSKSKSKLVKEQEASGLVYEFRKNKIVNTFLLAGGKFLPEVHSSQSGFLNSA